MKVLQKYAASFGTVKVERIPCLDKFQRRPSLPNAGKFTLLGQTPDGPRDKATTDQTEFAEVTLSRIGQIAFLNWPERSDEFYELIFRVNL
jgi:hypothetical protein